MFSKIIKAGIEFELPRSFALSISLGNESIQYSYYNFSLGNVFSKNNLLLLPLSIKKYFFLSKNSKTSVEFGFFISHHYKKKEEIRNPPAPKYSITKKNIGFNVGGINNISLKTRLTKKIFFDIGLIGLVDFDLNSSSNPEKLLSEKTGLSFSFYYKL
jgi:hypothetical protein